MRREFSDLLGRFLGPGFMTAMRGDGGVASFGVDIREDADHVYVEADMPGFTKDEVNVSLQNGVLTISAEKQSSPEPAGGSQQQPQSGNYLLRERRYERLERSFTLPPNVDQDRVNARLENGCLGITLHKTPESKPRKIHVS
jgi:HSP20 family protein